MMMGTFLFVLLLALLILFFLRQLWSQRHLPPGPLALPLVGTLWAYGISFREDYFRIIFSNGHVWKQQRHIGITTLRKLGLGKKSIEHQIEDAAQTLVETFKKTKGQPFDPSMPVINTATNFICTLSFGHQFAPEDENFQKLIQALEIIVKFGGSFFYVKTCIEFIVIFIFHFKHQSRNDTNSTYNEENLARCIVDFFGAGTETTFIILMWALLLLTNYPDIQEKVQKEIEDAFSSSVSISYQDRKKLPYTNAVIHEMQRLKSVFLVGLPRQTTKDVTVKGYHIPKSTMILPDLRSVLLDPEQWETPEEFNPNHFLDKDGKFIEREEFLPFGIGQRACVGEQLARIEIFIFLTNLLRAFSFRLPEGVKELNEAPIVNVTMHPHPYKLCAIPTKA
ncbi:cytochrome P450 2J2-like [Protobothrops mucrosquamatus]|uniref:cytochrome P450 2J2-like n=1 Tax=Protobothrops mucrosquamatus TaxID=103944 RepID=UPI0010FBB869|nr:cytochrome P450 2J2-like [Protobothrops mucrosquamatus]